MVPPETNPVPFYLWPSVCQSGLTGAAADQISPSLQRGESTKSPSSEAPRYRLKARRPSARPP